MDCDTQYMKNYVEELEKENRVLRQLIQDFLIEGPDEENQVWIQFAHASMKDGCALRVSPNQMSGQVVMNFGKILNDVKANLRA